MEKVIKDLSCKYNQNIKKYFVLHVIWRHTCHRKPAVVGKYLMGILPVCSFHCVVMGISLGHQVWWHELLPAHQASSPALIVSFHGDKLSLYVLCRSGWPWIYRDLMRLKVCLPMTDNFLFYTWRAEQ